MSGGGEKTEQPTPKRLRDAQQKGQVAFSREAGSAAILVVLFAYIGATWDFTMEQLRGLVDEVSNLYGADFLSALDKALMSTFMVIFKLSVPPVLLAALVGIAAGFFQVGAILAFDSIKPDLNKLNPAQGMKKIFSMKNLIELIKNVVKVGFIGTLLYIVIKQFMPDLVKLSCGGVDMIMPATAAMMKRIAVNTSLAFIVIAVFDVFFQRRAHIKELMMSPQEVKQEYKEMEGSPEIKSQRRHLHQELVAGDAPAKTKSATAVVTNPIHLAVALYYNQGETKVPVVHAKGEGMIAHLMKKTAIDAGIPVFENVPLAQALFHDVPVGEYIPSSLIEPVAEVLRWAREIKANNPLN